MLPTSFCEMFFNTLLARGASRLHINTDKRVLAVLRVGGELSRLKLKDHLLPHLYESMSDVFTFALGRVHTQAIYKVEKATWRH